jgi:hypothetical protein
MIFRNCWHLYFIPRAWRIPVKPARRKMPSNQKFAKIVIIGSVKSREEMFGSDRVTLDRAGDLRQTHKRKTDTPRQIGQTLLRLILPEQVLHDIQGSMLYC